MAVVRKKILRYRQLCINHPDPVAFMPVGVDGTSVRIHDDFSVSTFQNMISLHFYYLCVVVLWQGLWLSLTLHPTCWRHFYVFAVFFRVLFSWGFAFFEGKKIVLAYGRECHTKGWKRDRKGQKKISIFFHCTCLSAVNSLHNCTCSARAVPYDIPPLFVYCSYMFTVKHRLWLTKYWRNRVNFVSSCSLANIKGSVGLILAKTSVMRLSIPLDLSSWSFIPLPCFIRSRSSTTLLTPSLVLSPLRSA
jgi:hypothetical protein